LLKDTVSQFTTQKGRVKLEELKDQRVFAQYLVKENILDQNQMQDPHDFSAILSEFRALDSTNPKIYLKAP
jgi:hypothetical protein